MEKRRMSKPIQIVIGALTVLLALYLALGFFFWQATRPYSTARREAISVARAHTDLTKAQAFDIATTDSTTYAVVGLDKDQQKIGVLIPKNGGDLTVVELDKGVSPQTLASAGTTSVVLALYKDKPAWQVNSRTGFKLYDFMTGKSLL